MGYFVCASEQGYHQPDSYDIDTVNVSLSDDGTAADDGDNGERTFVMMVLISPRLVLVFAFTLPLSVCITRYLTGKTRPLSRRGSSKAGSVERFVEEMVSGQKTLKAYCQEENTIDRFEGKK